MILVGLTGGIGAGKSTVSQLLAERGAVIIDADAITRQLQEPGQPVLAAIVERFGSGILSAEGALDRPALAELVFNDPDALKDLNGLVHPAVGREIARRIDIERDSDRVVVLDVPLLVETGRRGMAGVVVVDATARRRRGSTRAPPGHERGRRPRPHGPPGQPRGAPRQGRLGDRQRRLRADLLDQVDRLWAWLQTLPPADPPDAPAGPKHPPEPVRNTRLSRSADPAEPSPADHPAKSCLRVQEPAHTDRTSVGGGVAREVLPEGAEVCSHRQDFGGSGVRASDPADPAHTSWRWDRAAHRSRTGGPEPWTWPRSSTRRSPGVSSSGSASIAGWSGVD